MGAGPIVRSKFLPVALGGVPRKYKLLALWPDGEIAREVAKWVESGDYHTFPVDSEYSMEDVVKVWHQAHLVPWFYVTDSHFSQGYEKVASKRARGKVVINVSE